MKYPDQGGSQNDPDTENIKNVIVENLLCASFSTPKMRY